MSKKVIELIRVSTESQAGEDRASIPAQRAINRRTAKAYDLQIIRSIEVSDVSGAAVLRAPEIQEMLRLIADPQIHGVLAREFSRLMRPEDFTDYALLQEFVDTKTILYLPEGPIDFTNKTGRLFGAIRAAMAGMERSEILERVWSAKEEKRRAGGFAQGRIALPFGVDYKEGQGWRYTADAEKVREVFRMFLSGETSYWNIGRALNLAPTNIKVFLRNPIYTGWRVIDKKRDMASSARRTRKGGRQGDRPKIKREPDEIIRVKVITEPLVTIGEFQRVQQMMEMKRSHSWKADPDYKHRFTYNGFLTCALCGGIIYSKFRRKDYYVCKAQSVTKTCTAHGMRRDRLEPEIDSLMSKRLTDRGFLTELTQELEHSAKRTTTVIRVDKLQAEIESLKKKRARVLDTYFEGVIEMQERDGKLTEIDLQIRANADLIMRERPPVDVSFETLVDTFSAFVSWEFLKRDDKRKLLATVVPDVRVADYQVHGLYLLQNGTSGYNYSPTDAASVVAAPLIYLALPVNGASVWV